MSIIVTGTNGQFYVCILTCEGKTDRVKLTAAQLKYLGLFGVTYWRIPNKENL